MVTRPEFQRIFFMPNLDPTSVLGSDGVIARRLPSYEHRDEQLAMAGPSPLPSNGQDICVVEAGTGVGKSFAYLVPAIQAAVALKKKVVVSTHTIALQEQLVGKDIPFLRSVMGQEFSAVLVKGRSNYISLRRLDVALQQQFGLFADRQQTDQLLAIEAWAKRTDDGSRADLDYRPFPAVWDAVQSEDGNCLGKQCPRHAECFFYAARRRAAERQHPDREPRALRHRSGLARGRLRPAARLRSRDHRRGAHAGIGRRRAPGAEARKPRRRLHAVSAL